MADTSSRSAWQVARAGYLPDVAVLGVAVVWGASYPVAKIALAYAPVLVLIVLRFSLTSVVMTAASWADLRGATRGDLMRAAALGGILSLIFAAETFGVQRTTASNTAVLISLCTLMTPMLEYGLAGRLAPRPILLGAAVSCFGTGLLGGSLLDLGFGDVLVLCAAALRACMVVATKRLMTDRPLSSAALTAVQAWVVMTLAALWLIAAGSFGSLRLDAPPPFWAAVAFLSLLCTIAAFYVQNAAVRRTNPTRVSFLMGTEPLFGFWFSHLLLGEAPSLVGLLGAALVVFGTMVGLSARR